MADYIPVRALLDADGIEVIGLSEYQVSDTVPAAFISGIAGGPGGYVYSDGTARLRFLTLYDALMFIKKYPRLDPNITLVTIEITSATNSYLTEDLIISGVEYSINFLQPNIGARILYLYDETTQAPYSLTFDNCVDIKFSYKYSDFVTHPVNPDKTLSKPDHEFIGSPTTNSKLTIRNNSNIKFYYCENTNIDITVEYNSFLRVYNSYETSIYTPQIRPLYDYVVVTDNSHVYFDNTSIINMKVTKASSVQLKACNFLGTSTELRGIEISMGSAVYHFGQDIAEVGSSYDNRNQVSGYTEYGVFIENNSRMIWESSDKAGTDIYYTINTLNSNIPTINTLTDQFCWRS